MDTASGKRKLPSDFHHVESEVTSLSSDSYPNNFHVGQAIGNGSCFFDSFRQGLEQQTGMQVTVEQLRNDCKEFAQNNLPEWFINKLRNETVDDYATNIMRNDRWGNPDIEGRILCEKYGVKLHVVEDQSYFKYLQREVSQDRGGFSKEIQHVIMDYDSNEALTKKLQKINSDEAHKLLKNVIDQSDLANIHCLINSSGEVSLDNLDYNDQDTIHIVNNGESHFEPLLDRNKSLAKQIQEQKLVQEQEDFQLAKKLQLDEILEYCNLSKDISERAEVEKRFDELLAKNSNKEIGDVVGQCVSDVQQRMKRSEGQNPLPSCSMEEPRVTSHQQQQIPVK